MYVAVHTLDQYKHSGAAVCSLFLYHPAPEVLPYSVEFDAQFL